MNQISRIQASAIKLATDLGVSTMLRPYCDRHSRWVDRLPCPTCQRELDECRVERIRIEAARQAAVTAECADRAEMWAL